VESELGAITAAWCRPASKCAPLAPTLEWYARQQAARGRCVIEAACDGLAAELK